MAAHEAPRFASESWKNALSGRIDPGWSEEIDDFESQIELRKQGKIEEKVFAETRLRRGAYGQRYDAGTRHDGVEERKLGYDDVPTKGPDTIWDAPGMQRIKIPYGGMSPEQLEVLADLAEEYSDGILHITTRQDIQLHFVHIEDTPDLMRRLAAVDITTREACGNSVRNVTGCPLAGTCKTSSSPRSRAANTRPAGWCSCTMPASCHAFRTASAASRWSWAAVLAPCPTRRRYSRSSPPKTSS
jgi:sulfite reductase (ferredoxin)